MSSKSQFEFTVTTKINQDVDVVMHLDDVVEKINEMAMVHRWNYIGKLLNEISLDIDSLEEQYKKPVFDYLVKQIDKFYMEDLPFSFEFNAHEHDGRENGLWADGLSIGVEDKTLFRFKNGQKYKITIKEI